MMEHFQICSSSGHRRSVWIANHDFYLTGEMATTTPLPNGIWVVQWPTNAANSSQNVQCDQTSLQIISTITNQGQVTLSLKKNPGEARVNCD